MRRLKTRAVLVGLVCTMFLLVPLARGDDAPQKQLLSSQAAVTSPAEELRARVGKPVTVMLMSGQEVSGLVEAVGEASVRISQLTGKEFYSAVVRLQDVSAVVYRAK